MGIEQEVFEAFQIEHREQLQRIRSLLVEMQGEAGGTCSEQLDEAFRMAHSLKGGARICDLRPAEKLGHGLETVFSRLREGELALDDDLVRTVNVVLDGIEDWMEAVVDTESPPEPAEALEALNRFVGDDPSANAERAPALPLSFERQLRLAFLSEYSSYTDGLRELISRRGPGVAGDRDDIFRLAHDLRASARAAGEEEVARLTAPLETLCRRMIDHETAWTEDDCQTAEAILRSIEDRILECVPPSRSVAGSPGPVNYRSHQDTSPSGPSRIASSLPTAPVAPTEQAQETVRVRADSLDRLLQSSAQLMVDDMRQDQVARELFELRTIMDAMQTERESLRRASNVALQMIGDAPELRRVARCVAALDARLQKVNQNIRSLCLTQQRNAWTLRTNRTRIQADIRNARMVSALSLFQGFPKMVRDLARDQGKQAELKVSGADVRADRAVLQSLKDPLMHMLRNAVTHGIESPDQRSARGKPVHGRIDLIVKTTGNRLQITVQDDGRGIDLDRIAQVAAETPVFQRARKSNDEELKRLIFEPGFTTCTSVTDLAGRGMGLNVVHEAVKRLQGNLQLLDREAPGASISLTVPLTVCAQRLLLLSTGGQAYGLPLHAAERLLRVDVAGIEAVEGQLVIPYQRQLIPIVSLAGLLGSNSQRKVACGEALPTVIMASATRRLAVTVDAFLGEQDAVVQNLDAAASSKEVSGAILTPDGKPLLVLDPAQLLVSVLQRTVQPSALQPSALQPSALQPSALRPAAPRDAVRPRILVVDDSFTTRTLEKSILETHGYEVHVATDGVEALAQLQTNEYAAVLSDLEMPRLDGFGLLEAMKKHPKMSDIPVVLVTSRDRPEDQQRGMELGADAYIFKRKFDHQDLLATIEQMIAPSSHG